MNVNQLQEQRNKLMTDATALMQGDNVTAETRSQFDKMLADVSVIDSDINRVKAVEEYRASLNNPINQPKPTPGESHDVVERSEVRNQEIRSSFRNYLVNGVKETRDLTVLNTGVAIPQLFNPQLVEAQKSYGEIYNLVNLLKTDNGSPMKMVFSNDTSAGLTSLTVGTAAGEADPPITGATLNVDNFTAGVIKIDNGLLTDAGFDVEAFIRDAYAKRFYRGASNLIVNGDAGAVASLTAAYNTNFITSAVVNKVEYLDFATAMGTLDPAYQQNACWTMSNATLGYVIGLVDANNRPLFLPDFGSAASGYAGTILGKPVKVVTQLPAVATGNFPILFGDYKEGYTFRVQNPGLGIVKMSELFATGFETGFVAFARCGGIATNAGVPPVLSIKVQ